VSWTHVVGIASDLHCNSTVGLCPPEGVTLDDGGRHMPSNAQVWQFERWIEFWDEVDEIRRQHNATLIASLNGDLVDGDHHGTAQIITRNTLVQGDCAKSVIDYGPCRIGYDAMLVERGTESHVGKQAMHEEALARLLPGVVADPENPENYSVYHRRARIGGKLFDFQHHGRTGYRPWTKGSMISILAVEIATRAAFAGLPIPDFAIRSHVHQWACSDKSCSPTRAMTTPPWQLKTMFGHMVAAEAIAGCGGVIICIDKHSGDSRVIPKLYTAKLPEIWEAP
jgi:hypothetical protein